MKVHTQPRSPKDHACDVVNYLSSVLFPPGVSNAPIEQLQQFYGAAVANKMVSANDIDKRNLTDSSTAAAAAAAATTAGDGRFLMMFCRGVQKTQNRFRFGFINQNRTVQKFDIRSDGFPTETACNSQYRLKQEK